MCKKKNGFTLVELLAVIVILAVILAIAVPGISNVIGGASKNALESDAKLIIKAIEYKILEDDSFDPTTVNESNIESLLDINSDNYEMITTKELDNKTYITIIGKNKWDNLTVSGTEATDKVINTVPTNYVRGANAPVLATGMVPIKWNGTSWEDTTESDSTWYNYDPTNKQWANARSADGSMWVWIPRFIYKISSGWHTNTAGTIDIQFSKGIDDDWNEAVIGAIDLHENANSSNNAWTNHPAFTFGEVELSGIWVSKFEASGTTSAVKFAPNVASLRGETIGSYFTASRNIETNSIYGWGTSGNGIDTHLIKNTEWGAVAYLAQSTYGKNAEVWINNSSTFTTGCAGSSVSATPYSGCANAYNTTNGVQASTTGNIYGVYDMVGGAWECVAAYVNNGNANLSNGDAIVNADAKYKNVYSIGATDTDNNNYSLTLNKKGDAFYETSSGSGALSWNSDFSYMLMTQYTWLERGGGQDNGANAGLFSNGRYDGSTSIYFGFHTTLAVSEGL